MKLVIGLSGKIGSGKTVVSNYLYRRYGAKQMRFSQILMDILDRLHLPSERESLQKLGHALRTSVGEDVIVNAFRKDLEAEKSRIIVVDGVRYPNEVDMVRSFPGSLFIYIDAPQKIRYERCVKRGEKGEASISFKEFKESEERETERHLDRIAETADYIIDNEGPVDDLYRKIDEILKNRVSQKQPTKIDLVYREFLSAFKRP